ncbi:hypothetical protein ACIBH1_45670 [Nonomuraea sp. NPDC050663]|uniref:hypothetical protein n=1 Tax=Nonomuraea sp. NPDC050663 TaxID=3364370 RepID=UPI0037916B6B
MTSTTASDTKGRLPAGVIPTPRQVAADAPTVQHALDAIVWTYTAHTGGTFHVPQSPSPTFADDDVSDYDSNHAGIVDTASFLYCELARPAGGPQRYADDATFDDITSEDRPGFLNSVIILSADLRIGPDDHLAPLTVAEDALLAGASVDHVVEALCWALAQHMQVAHHPYIPVEQVQSWITEGLKEGAPVDLAHGATWEEIAENAVDELQANLFDCTLFDLAREAGADTVTVRLGHIVTAKASDCIEHLQQQDDVEVERIDPFAIVAGEFRDRVAFARTWVADHTRHNLDDGFTFDNLAEEEAAEMLAAARVYACPPF